MLKRPTTDTSVNSPRSKTTASATRGNTSSTLVCAVSQVVTVVSVLLSRNLAVVTFLEHSSSPGAEDEVRSRNKRKVWLRSAERSFSNLPSMAPQRLRQGLQSSASLAPEPLVYVRSLRWLTRMPTRVGLRNMADLIFTHAGDEWGYAVISVSRPSCDPCGSSPKLENQSSTFFLGRGSSGCVESSWQTKPPAAAIKPAPTPSQSVDA